MKLERKDEIVRIITENRVVKANELAEYFDVSTETIRRDLADLEKEKYVKRVHGGAILNVAGGEEPEFSSREISNYEQKMLIGRKAASYVEDGDTIIIDIGTTTLEFARFLKGKKITVLTNSVNIAIALMNERKMQVILLGGNIREGEGTTSGYWAERMIDEYYVDKLFLGVGAIDSRLGVTDYHIEETNVRRHYIEHSRKVYALADYSKFGRSTLNKVCNNDQIDVLITDDRADKREIKRIRNQGVEIVFA